MNIWRWSSRTPLLLMTPAMVVFALFLVYPLQEILRVSFARERGLDPLFEDTYYL